MIIIICHLSQHSVSESLIIPSHGNSTISTKTSAETADLFGALGTDADGGLMHSKPIEMIFTRAWLCCHQDVDSELPRLK